MAKVKGRISTVGPRDVVSWQRLLSGELAPATVDSHDVSLSGFTGWVAAQAPHVFAGGDPRLTMCARLMATTS